MSRSATTPGPAALPIPGGERWTLLRVGIQNVWEYDDRRFVFERGRLLLRGQNEAGKTKAMELLFPFLLDADSRRSGSTPSARSPGRCTGT